MLFVNCTKGALLNYVAPGTASLAGYSNAFTGWQQHGQMFDYKSLGQLLLRRGYSHREQRFTALNCG